MAIVRLLLSPLPPDEGPKDTYRVEVQLGKPVLERVSVVLSVDREATPGKVLPESRKKLPERVDERVTPTEVAERLPGHRPVSWIDDRRTEETESKEMVATVAKREKKRKQPNRKNERSASKNSVRRN